MKVEAYLRLSHGPASALGTPTYSLASRTSGTLTRQKLYNLCVCDRNVAMCAKALILLVAAVLGAGCASSLKVWDEDGGKLSGIPFKMGEVFVIKGTYGELSRDSNIDCLPQDFYETVILPVGSTYYVNFDSDWLAKSDFGVTFHDNGVLASVSVNSDVAGGIKAASESLTQLLPFAGISRKEETAEDAGQALQRDLKKEGDQPKSDFFADQKPQPVPLCDGAPRSIRFIPLTQLKQQLPPTG